MNAKLTYNILVFIDYNMKHAKGAKMPRGNKNAILEYKIPVPPLSTQRKIVEVLDKFDTLVNSISDGLPREIELRRKQYEYYRDLLLNFKEKSA
ncbi:restriction endonuclease subunit S [uncultured Campylobacter sp.]|uniref:restriction endonuclease subunit S n=1 Tax=uncultured Campylobacter sp. TaxID=218934 RepID=UPI00262276FD|nr:restriction endonuclease subunit S [uncultured Campylobacter sp.]